MATLINIEDFSTAVADAARLAFNSVLGGAQKSTVYGFSLYTVDDLAGIVPSASTESGFLQRKDKVLADEKQLAWLKEESIDVNRFILGDHRWSIYEWDLETEGASFFDGANETLANMVAEVEDTGGSFTQLTAEVLASMTIALHQLRTDKFFDNPQITLFCSKPSSLDTAWLERESARVLNSLALFEIFQKERIAWIQEDGDDAAHALPIYRRIVAEYCQTK
jgi:hypothetical protein